MYCFLSEDGTRELDGCL